MMENFQRLEKVKHQQILFDTNFNYDGKHHKLAFSP